MMKVQFRHSILGEMRAREVESHLFNPSCLWRKGELEGIGVLGGAGGVVDDEKGVFG